MPTTLPPNSFYLVSYPRSGNTWLINCLTTLVDGVPGEAYTAYKLYTEHHGRPGESFTFWCMPRRRPDQPICVKSHDALPLFRSRHPAGPLVYIARDARDSLISYYFFKQAYPTIDAEKLTFTQIKGQEVVLSRSGQDPVFQAEAFTQFLRTEAPLWAAHVREAKADHSMCFVTYEELKHRFIPTLTRIGDYLQLPLVKSYVEVDGVYNSDFKKMFSGSNRDFFRRGEIGDWKNWFTREHARLLEELIGPDLRALGFETDPAWAQHYVPARGAAAGA
ncbi:MAG: hypothetical protein EXS42_00280 [Lacunisphaera sp.]|nr:hypothetical protein [Lacunisphaera sp.]